MYVYIAGFTEKVAKDLRVVNVGVTFQKGRTIFNSICKLKPLKHPDEKKNLIYCLGCKSCDQHYIGETQQLFSSRKYQHEYAIRHKKSTNGLAQHLMINKNIRLTGEEEHFWTLNHIGENGRSKKHFLLTPLTRDLIYPRTI